MSSRPAIKTERVLVIVLSTLVGLLAAFVMLVLVRPAGAQEGVLQPLLPDLTEDLPKLLSVHTRLSGGRKSYRLAFRSAAENRTFVADGGGPLILVGHRASRATKTLAVDQYVELFDPHTGRVDTQQVHRNVGTMRFIQAEDHGHWHQVGFQRYELRRASDYRLVAPDRKTGFCVGNRYRLKPRVQPSALRAFTAATPRLTFEDFSGECGKSQPGLLSLTVGLSPNSGDDYKPLVEGQFINITKVPSGKYVLVHRANPSRRIKESNYTNNASSVLLSIRKRAGRKPTVKTLAKCLGSDRCKAPATPR